MITAKQRSYLKSLANPLKPIAQLGKEGISDSFLAQIDKMLSDHELVKVSVLETNMLDAREACIEVASKTRAEFIQAIGRKFVIYREAKDKKPEDRIQLPVQKKKK